MLCKLLKIAENLLIYFFWIAVMAGVVGCYLLGLKPYIVRSGSMEPAVRTGSLCLVDTKASYGCVREGDIIAYESSLGMYVTHRVIRITEEGMETKGDSNLTADGISVTEKNFMGITRCSIPGLGYLSAFLQSVSGKILTIVFIVFFCLLRKVSDF